MINKPKHPYGIYVYSFDDWNINYRIYAVDEDACYDEVKGSIKLLKADMRWFPETKKHYVFLSKKTINTDITRFEKETGTKHVSFEYHDRDFNLKQKKL